MRCDPDNKDKKFETTCSQGFDCTQFAAVVKMSDCVIADYGMCAKDPMNMNLKGNALACACNYVYFNCAKTSSCTLQKGFHDGCESACLAKQCTGSMSEMSGSNTQASFLVSGSKPGVALAIAALAFFGVV
jgi:hypothetical protein